MDEPRLSERQMGVVDYFVEQLNEAQSAYNQTYIRLQQYVTDAANGIGIDMTKNQFDPATGVFSPLPEQSAD